MPTCPIHLFLPSGTPTGGLPEVLAASGLPAALPEVVELLSRHALVAMAVAASFGFLVGWLARRRSPAKVPAPASGASGLEELRWRHEKLVLTERQQVEKQARLDSFVAALEPASTGPGAIVKLQAFLVSERIREARQKVGSDLSRMKAARDRLDALLPSVERGREAVGACRGMAEAQAARLEEAREILRDLAGKARKLEEAVLAPGPVAGETGLRREFVALKGGILTLPQGWSSSGEETDRRIRELLATLDHPALGPVREILLVDGAFTASLAGASHLDLIGAVSSAISAFDRLAAAKAAAAKAKAEAADEPPAVATAGETAAADPAPPAGPVQSLLDTAAPAEPPLDFGFPGPTQPDPAFRSPSEFTPLAVRLSKGFRDLTQGNGKGAGPAGETASSASAPEPAVADLVSAIEEDEDSERALVLFCSNDVELWGRTLYRGARCRARAIAEFPDWARWISIRRLDTNERVFSPIRTASLRSGLGADPFGFNGTNELFYGARHLGLFSETCPNEVETRFTYGGWGFGHRAVEIAPEVEQLQAAGWEGREIPADTVFEIVIHEELPSLGKRDRILEGEVRAVR